MYKKSQPEMNSDWDYLMLSMRYLVPLLLRLDSNEP